MPEERRPYKGSSDGGQEKLPGARMRHGHGSYDEAEDEAVAYWEDEPTDSGENASGHTGLTLRDALRPPAEPDDGRLQEISSFLSREFEGTERKLPAGPLAGAGSEGAGDGAASGAGISAETAAQPAGTPASMDPRQPVPAEEPFFPIPDEIPPLPHEDTETAPPEVMMLRERKSPLQIFMNLVFWSILFVVFFVVLIGLIYLKYARDRLYTPNEGAGREFVLTVNSGDRLGAISERLRAEDMLGSYMGIDDVYLMKLLARINENSDQIKSGAYRLNTGMSLNDVYERLLKGSQDFKVTIPEGMAVRDVAQLLKRRYETFDEQKFIELTKDRTFIESLGFRAPSLEGYLYPNTYSFQPGMKEADMIKAMVDTFTRTMKSKLAELPSDSLSFHEHVIMASLIEREARIDKDRPLIASVLFNRLAKGMRLDVDATVLYALGSWNRKLTKDDLKIDSPYNTRKYKGLPPGPICSPRLASIMATYQAPSTKYLYYVYTGRGDHAFAETLEEHNANVRLYLKSQDAAAGADAAGAAGRQEAGAADAPKPAENAGVKPPDEPAVPEDSPVPTPAAKKSSGDSGPKKSKPAQKKT